MNNARKLIGDWKRLIKVYRSESEKLAKEYIQLTKTGSEDEKIALIETFESFFPSAERNCNHSLTILDDHLARVDNQLENDSDDEYAVIDLNPAKRVKLQQPIKEEAVEEEEIEEAESDYSSDSDESDETDSDTE